MALVIADRVRETTTSTGTGTITLAGPYTGFQAFSVIGNGNTTYYALIDAATGAWEVGIGTYTATGNTLSRDTVLSSSNGGAAVNFSAGTKDVIITQPASRAVYLDTASNVTIPGITLSGGTANGVAYLNGSKVLTTGSALTFDGTNLYIGGVGQLQFATSGGVNTNTIQTVDSFNMRLACNRGATSYFDVATDGQRFGISGSEQMRLTSTGLGIGTSSPASKLEVAGTTTDVVSRITATTGAAYHRYGNSGQTFYVGLDNSTGSGFGAAYASVLYANGAYPMVFSTNATERMRITSAGNVGIGTSSPSAVGSRTTVHVNGTAGAALRLSDDVANAYLDYTDTSGARLFVNAAEPLLLGTNSLERMRIDSAGNVSIGATSNPVSRFGVTASSASVADLYRTGAAGEARLNFYNDNASSAATVAGRVAALLTTTTAGAENGALLFGTTAAGTTAERMRIDSAGNVGIGTSSPTTFGYNKTLTISDATSVSLGLISGSNGFFAAVTSSGAPSLNATNNQPLLFATGGSERMRLDSTGNLLIGTTTNSNSSKLVVNGTISETVGSTQYLVASQYDIGTAPNQIPLNQYLGTMAYQDSASISVANINAASQALTIGNGQIVKDSSGNLGLGVTPSGWGSAWKSYQVKNSNVASSNYDLVHASNAYNNGTNWIYATSQTASLYYQNGNAHQWYQAPSGTAGNAITFTQAMTLDANGRLLVGTTTAGAYITGFNDSSAANTVGRFVQANSGSATNGAVQAVTATTGGSALDVGHWNNSGASNWVQRWYANVGRTVSGNVNDAGAIFLAGLNADGNLGLGVTPAVWTNGKAFQLSTTTALFNDTTDTYFGNNFYYNAGFKYLTTAAAMSYRIGPFGFAWYTAPSGTAGSAFTFTERMRLDSSGNLGLGVTPSAWSSSYKVIQGQAGGFALSNDNTNNNQMHLSSNAYNNGTNWIYYGSSTATSYAQQVGQHRWYTAPSGTAGNAISFTQAMTLDASGNLLVGATTVGYSAKSQFVKQGSTSANNSVTDSAVMVASANAAAGETIGLRLKTGAGISGTTFPGQLISAGNNIFEIYTAAAVPLVFGTDATERARIDSSGNVMIRNTTRGGHGTLTSDGIVGLQPAISCYQNATTSQEQITFRNPNGVVGNITTNGTATAYNTSSDYRLKDSITPMTGALAKVAALKPVTYKWKADGSDGEGFIAHELAEVVPQCVTGEKDAVDADGNPVYQGIDTSFLVATLTAAIQEQQAIIEELRQRVAVLEGNSTIN